ncbi:MAG: FG-GAP-like repeat-containing protein [Pirellula sp.]|nr:FG-GAP-like repeat-containing protein [Pirellula sp.]
MLAVDGWHNVLQPLSVLADPNQDVSPLDVLVVINEINGRRYSDTFGNLPDQPPVGERPPYFDVNCNGSVEPLDVLMVINHLNGGPKPTSWNLATANQSSGSGFISAASCSPQLNEGTSLRTELVTDLVIPNENSAVRVTFRQPVFDTASVGQMRDAFEISVRDISGNLLVLPYQPRLEAVVNWSENSTTVNGPAVQMQSAPNEWTSTINLVGIAAGTRAQVSVRLLNNDSDTASNVVVRGVEVIPATGPNPVGSPWSTDSLSANEPIRWPMMQEITGSVAAKYGRTTYINDRSTLIAEVAFENLGSAPIRSAIAVLDNLSHLSIQPLQPDGYTDDGRPYWRIGASSADRILNSNATSQTRGIGFSSTALDRFTFDWRIYGELLQGEVAFQSRPDDVIERGNIYQYQAVASSSLGGSVRYTLMSGPRSVTLSETTGALSWVTTSLDMGRHQFVMRATDDYGNEALQSFSVDVRSQLVNRPPIFTSEPETDAKISSPFEVHTYATGQGPEAATLLPSRFGLMHVVTANSADNQLGLLPSGPFVLGDTQAIGLGERPSSELSGLFEGPMALELGIVPTTEGRYERNVQQVLAEDINGDGNPDAVALVNLQASGNWSDPNDRGFLVVRYGNGDGSFREGWQVQFPTVAGRIGRGATLHYEDVTSDGLKDFVVTTIATNRILVYANTGTGSFDSNPITSPAVGNYVSLTQIADMNRDGKLDLVLFENTQVQIGGRQAISIYHGDGAGRFTEAMVIAEDTNNGGRHHSAELQQSSSRSVSQQWLWQRWKSH